MFICICNAISDREVKEAVEAGAVIWTDVHEHNGCEPNCGKCECDIVDFILRERETIKAEPDGDFGTVMMVGAD